MAIHAGGKAELVFLRLACGFYGGAGGEIYEWNFRLDSQDLTEGNLFLKDPTGMKGGMKYATINQYHDIYR